MADPRTSISSWQGPGAPPEIRRGVSGLFKRISAMIVPPRGQRFLPTATGYILILLAVGICIAAFNTGSNILFISLSLILAGLLLSGILSWVNFRGTCWRLQGEPPFRAGEKGSICVEIFNGKKMLPTYSIWFRLKTAMSRENGRVFLEHRLDPQCLATLEWVFEPAGRGIEEATLSGAISEFPFGFLRKSVGRTLSLKLIVWPRRIAYDLQESAVAQQFALQGESARRVGQGEDLINLRNYQQGDSQRLIHWKASARVRRLQVRQFASENQSAYFFFLQTSRKIWRDDEQFERFCRFVLTFAEDFFQESRLAGAAINDLPVINIKRYIDLAYFFDQLATLKVSDKDQKPAMPLKHNIVTFEPYGRSGVVAYAGGQKIATA